MSNPIIEVPEEIQATAQRVLADRESFLSSTVSLAQFIRDLNKPEIEVQNFVVYKVKYAGMFYAGFRFEASHCWKKWIIVELNGDNPASEAVPQFGTAVLVEDSDVEVLERWTPEAPQPEFGIGDPDDRLEDGREVLVKGVLHSRYADGDGDARVTFRYSGNGTDIHYVNTADIAYAEEVN